MIAWLAAAAVAATAAGDGGREEVARPLTSYVWDLDAVYPDPSSWNAEREAIESDLVQIALVRERPVHSAADLALILDLVGRARGRAGKMAKVGLLQSELDTGSDSARSRFNEGVALESRVESEVAFLGPLVRSIDAETLDRWMAEEPRVARHERRIRRIIRLAPYAQPTPGASADDLPVQAAVAMSEAYGALMRSNLAWPAVPGRPEAKLDPSAFAELSGLPDPGTRYAAYEIYLNHLRSYEAVFGILLTQRIAAHRAAAKRHRLDDSTDFLFVLNDGFAPGAYRAMFPAVREAQPAIASAARTLGRLHGLGKVRYEDLFARPPGVSLEIPVGEAFERTLEVVRPLGDDYRRLLEKRLEQPWWHLPPLERKSNMVGVFWHVGGGHPHVVMPYGGDYRSARALAGAATLLMGYSAVPNEIAPDRREEDLPIFSNALWYVGRYLYDRDIAADLVEPDERVAVLATQLTAQLDRQVRNTIVAELEAILSERIGRGEGTTGAAISAIYLDLLRSYYGDAVEIGDHLSGEWMTFGTLFYGPHYATWAAANAAALSLEQGIRTGDQRVKASVRDGIGRSRTHFSADVLGDAGIDLSTAAPYRRALGEIGELAGRLDAALDAR